MPQLSGEMLPAVTINGITMVWQDFGFKGEVEDKEYYVPGNGVQQAQPMRRKPMEIDLTSLVAVTNNGADFVDSLKENTDVPRANISIPGRTIDEGYGDFFIKTSNVTAKINDLSELKITIKSKGYTV